MRSSRLKISDVIGGRKTTRKGYRCLSIKEATHTKLVQIANILEKSVPDTIDELADRFLNNRRTQDSIREQEGRT
jgi:hypothetical protein